MLVLGLCFHSYFVAVLCEHVFEKFKWFRYQFVCHYCLFLSIDLLCCLGRDEAGSSASMLLYIFIGSVPGLWVLKENLLSKVRHGKGHLPLLFVGSQPASSSCRGH